MHASEKPESFSPSAGHPPTKLCPREVSGLRLNRGDSDV